MIYMILLVINVASGQEARKIKYQKETEIDFDGLEITGEMVKPQGSLIIERSGVRFNPLISLRTDWNQEMLSSVKEIK